MVLCTLQDIKDFVGNNNFSTTEIRRVNNLIRSKSSYLENVCNRWFELKTLTNQKLYRPDVITFQDKLILLGKLRDIVEITAFQEEAEVLTVNDDYYVEKRNGGLITIDGEAWTSKDYVEYYQVSGKFGYVNYTVDDTYELYGDTDSLPVGMQCKVTAGTINGHAVGDIFTVTETDDAAFTAASQKVIPIVKEEIRDIVAHLVAVASGLWIKNFEADGQVGQVLITSVPKIITERINQLRNVY